MEDVREDLTRAKHRLTHLLIRHGYAFDEIGPDGKRKGKWTRAHWEWIRSIELSEAAARDALDFYVSEVRHIEAQKKAIEKEIADYARADRWRGRVEALRRLKGIETMTAFSLVAEAGVFSRFESARAFSSWLGLTPSEHSSGERVSRGGIIKAGNTHLRKQLVESSWHYTRATTKRKRDQRGEEVPLAIENHAARGREAPCREAGSLCKAQSSPGGRPTRPPQESSPAGYGLWAACRKGLSYRNSLTFDLLSSKPFTSTGRWMRSQLLFLDAGLSGTPARRLFFEGARIQP